MTDHETSWVHDFGAGVLVSLVGAGAVVMGVGYGIGTLRQMQPGFFPVVLGAILICIGLTLGITALRHRARRDATLPLALGLPDWRGCAFIIGGVVAFLVIGGVAGLFPGAFACVFISALGDRTTGWRRALVLALCVAILGSLFFTEVLQVQMPLLTWDAR